MMTAVTMLAMAMLRIKLLKLMSVACWWRPVVLAADDDGNDDNGFALDAITFTATHNSILQLARSLFSPSLLGTSS